MGHEISNDLNYSNYPQSAQKKKKGLFTHIATFL